MENQIRSGIQKKIDIERIKKYVDWFFDNQLIPHFEIEMEEADIFPVLGNDHEMVKKAFSEHKRLIRLFKKKDEVLKTLSLLEEALESHIRFDERVLFN